MSRWRLLACVFLGHAYVSRQVKFDGIYTFEQCSRCALWWEVTR